MTNNQVGVWLLDDGTVGAPDPTNPYRYVGNNPTNLVDPTGLWSWKIDSKGSLIAVSEKDDTFLGLIEQNYDERALTWLLRRQGITKIDAKLQAGVEVDLSSLFPGIVQDAIRTKESITRNSARSSRREISPVSRKFPWAKPSGHRGLISHDPR